MALLLTDEMLTRGVEYLSARDADLARIVEEFGPPPMWAREPGFPTLIHIILEQQVSLASARAAFDRLHRAVSPLTPDGFLTLDDTALKAIGFSRQKIVYGQCLAQAILDGQLDLDALHALEDSVAHREMTKVKGIGRWSADIYLLMALRQPDTWPSGDLALAAAIRKVKGLTTYPRPDELEMIGEAWRPWRAVAARILWHYYLSTPLKTGRRRLGQKSSAEIGPEEETNR